ncbi:hypothetical protein [Conyzicola sp.]|uniref:hypothetical protein n=1 Tax=Conyzicola sp. TaxID=1969404 RepID=UPI0039892072
MTALEPRIKSRDRTFDRARIVSSNYALLAVIGIFVLPLGIILACNSYAAPGPDDYVRMAFGAVAASVIAMLTSAVLAVRELLATSGEKLWLTFVALVVFGVGMSSIISAGGRLLERLS